MGAEPVTVGAPGDHDVRRRLGKQTFPGHREREYSGSWTPADYACVRHTHWTGQPLSSLKEEKADVAIVDGPSNFAAHLSGRFGLHSVVGRLGRTCSLFELHDS